MATAWLYGPPSTAKQSFIDARCVPKAPLWERDGKCHNLLTRLASNDPNGIKKFVGRHPSILPAHPSP